MSYPRTGSTLTDNDPAFGNGGQGFNKTSISLSTMILVQVGDTPVGALQNLNITERREIKRIAEIGMDGFIDSAPSRATDVSGNCGRIRFDRLRLTEAFGRGFVHIHSQRIPFDISIIDFYSNDESTQIVTTIKNVWFTNISYEYKADDYIISDRADWQAETIFSKRVNASPTNVASGGEIGVSIWSDAVERAADIGNRRGSMDAPGLLRAVYTQF